MRFAVDLDKQFSLMAVEIADVGACSLLATKLQPRRTLLKFPPKQHLRQTHGLAELSRTADGRFRSAEHHPSTGFAGPPPLMGRILIDRIEMNSTRASPQFAVLF